MKNGTCCIFIEDTQFEYYQLWPISQKKIEIFKHLHHQVEKTAFIVSKVGFIIYFYGF